MRHSSLSQFIQKPRVATLMVLLAACLGAGPAAAKSGYGESVDAVCTSTKPFQAQGCLLCHNTADGSGAKGSTWSWYQSGNYSAFCPPTTANRAPNGTIDSPATNQSIAVGATMTFRGTGTDPDGDAVTLAWNFGVSTATGTGPHVVSYPSAGIYTVTLTVSDGQLSDPTPATRVITVGASCTDADQDGFCAPRDCNDANPAINPGAFEVCGDGIDNNCDGMNPSCATACLDTDGDGYSPDGGICGPEDCDDTDAFVNPGMAELCNDRIDNDCDDYLDETDRECNGGDCLGGMFPIPNQAPTCAIDAPAGNQTIDAGQAVTFAGTGADADGNLPLTHAWDFGGGASASSAQNPGAVSFARAGHYPVSFRVTDSLGLSCAPATVTITVREQTIEAPFTAHPISTSYVTDGHKADWRRRPDHCRSCHGADLKGTAASATFESRVWPSDRRQPDGSEFKRYAQGDWVGCLECHRMPDGDDDDDDDDDDDRDDRDNDDD